jgi:hypothetical protein
MPLLAPVTMKMRSKFIIMVMVKILYWDAMPCSLVDGYQYPSHQKMEVAGCRLPKKYW